jgi:hypothetical protein
MLARGAASHAEKRTSILRLHAMFRIDSSLFEVSLEHLRPTQITVGFDEVEKKRKSWAKLKPRRRLRAIREELFPVVKGPKGCFYVIDHHHTALAMLLDGCSAPVQAGLVKDLSHLKPEAFWTYLDHYSWMHAYDARGRKRSHCEIPARFEGMKDDPYRSFAGTVRDAGGFSKPDEPFQEFLWANFFRELIALKLLHDDQDKAMAKALKLARSKDAAHLPGWSGEQ